VPPKGWEQSPYGKAVARCGQRFIIQVRSLSKKAWVIDRARLEGSNGEVLKVSGIRFRDQGKGVSLNVLVAEAPQGANVSQLRLDLSSQDGRVAVVDGVVLP